MTGTRTDRPGTTATGAINGGVGFAVIDLETTGLSPARGARAIEVGMVLVDRSGTVEETWETLVDPGVGPGPTHIHGVTEAMLEGAPTFAEVAGDLAVRLDGRTIVAHNADFDMSFLEAEFGRIGLAWDYTALCTMRLARKRGLRPASLAACCATYGIVNRGAHHALGDAVATAELLGWLQVATDEVPSPVRFPAGRPDPSGRIHLRPDR